MRQDWTPEQLVDEWTLEEGDRKLLSNKSGATRLGFALKLKFFQIEGRFPSYAEEIPAAAVPFVADQVGVEPTLFGKYPWNTRVPGRHRRQIRDTYGTHATAPTRPPRTKRTNSPTGWPTRCARWKPAVMNSPKPFSAGASP